MYVGIVDDAQDDFQRFLAEILKHLIRDVVITGIFTLLVRCLWPFVVHEGLSGSSGRRCFH